MGRAVLHADDYIELTLPSFLRVVTNGTWFSGDLSSTDSEKEINGKTCFQKIRARMQKSAKHDLISPSEEEWFVHVQISVYTDDGKDGTNFKDIQFRYDRLIKLDAFRKSSG